MSWIEIISMLLGIPASVITILTASKNYIKSKKDSKKDPSASLPASDGSDDNLAKQLSQSFEVAEHRCLFFNYIITLSLNGVKNRVLYIV